MTEDDILRMAREAGGAWEYNRSHPVPCVMYDEELIKFARLVAAAERGRQPAKKLYTATIEFDFVMVSEPHMTDRIVGSVVGQAFRDTGWSHVRRRFREGVHVDQWKPTDIPYGEHWGKTIGEYLKEGSEK